MPDDQGTGVAVGADGPAPQNNALRKNPFSDVQNILGFLLAGFGGIISFLGLRSTEVTTVLRNDPGPASLVAAVLLLGVLAAILTVVIDSGNMQDASSTDAIGIAFLLIGLASFIIYAIPASASPSGLSGILALIFGGLGITVVGASLWVRTTAERATAAAERATWAMAAAERATAAAARATGERAAAWRATAAAARARAAAWRAAAARATAAAEGRPAAPGGGHGIRPTIIFLMISVTLIATSAYGAMRLETASQRSSSAQVAATLNGSGSTLTVHVTASKLEGGGYIWIAVEGLPVNPPIATACAGIDSTLKPDQATCEEDLCGPNRLQARCVWLMDGSVAPDASGDVDETVNLPIQPGKYQVLDIRASVCNSLVRGPNPSKDPIPTEGSRVDLLIPDSTPTG